MKNLLLRHAFVSLFFLSVTACSTTESPSISEKPIQRQSQQQENEKVSELSAGRDVKVKTSQGEIAVSPNVVAITDGSNEKGGAATAIYNDPWEDLNRAIFSFNHFTYEYFLIPAAKGYRYVVPAAARDKVGNAFENIREPLNLLNNAAAGEFKQAGANLGRFLINSTLGVFGLFDPAEHWFDIAAHRQTIGDTLERYDVGAGPYLVLPFLGPGDSRSAFSLFTESFIHPIDQLVDSPESYYIRSFDGFDDFSNQSDIYEALYKRTEDPYIYFRNQYIQGQRRDEYFQYKQPNDDN